MTPSGTSQSYFPGNLPLSRAMRERLRLGRFPASAEKGRRIPDIFFVRRVAEAFNRLPERSGSPVPAGLLNLFALQVKIFRYLIDLYVTEQQPDVLAAAARNGGAGFASTDSLATLTRFAELFPGAEILADAVTPRQFVEDDGAGTRKNALVREMLLLSLARENRAVDLFRDLFDHAEFSPDRSFGRFVALLDRHLSAFPPFAPLGMTFLDLLRAPLGAAPRSLAAQIGYMRDHWRDILPAGLFDELLVSLDIIAEEEREWWSGPGRPQVMEFLARGPGAAHDYPEYERFSPDADWMANVVMIAKMTYVWLDQLSKKYGGQIQRLDQIPDEELDMLSRWGFSGLWLIGIWERSPASQRIKQIGGNFDAISSAYSLHDYVIARDLGGETALENLKDRAWRRGIRLASDMVPNHTGIYSRWAVEHPDWFIQLDDPPYPDYTFNGPDLSDAPEVSLVLEDGYWDRSNAAVVFKHYDHRNGRTRYIYHGNDGTSTPWNDTAQLNYLIPEVREAVIRTILHVARQFPIIRFDAAMTLAKKHYQRLWYPQPGHGSGIPSRAEHGMSREAFDAVFPVEFWREVVDRVAAEVPDTLLLAEAFWLMEGYFVRTLGMHRVYNSAFMNMLKMEENAKYRQTLKNILEYDHRILQRFVNFMNNPDERTAVEQFGKEGKYFGAAVLLVTMPGLPMFGHGQIEGFHEKYGMEYRRAYWDEPVDEHLVRVHEERIFPLMRRRSLFSGSADFVLYDFFAGESVNEDVFAYSNRSGGERGLVFYHNRYGSTSGWIRMSAAMAGTGGDGAPALVRKSLGDALGINPDGRCYYAFRDVIAGLEYLRSGRELWEQGLHAAMGGYECRAFLDWREIVDDDYGTWGKLCHELEGRGVGSLGEEIKQVRYAGVIGAFRPALSAVFKILAAETYGTDDPGRVRFLLERLYDEFKLHTSCSGDSAAIAADTLREIESARRLSAGEESGESGGPVPDLLTAAWLVLHGTGRLSSAEDHAPVAAAWYGELGIDRAFAAAARELTEGEDAGLSSLLLRLLVRWQGVPGGPGGVPDRSALTLLFHDQNVRDFLGVHTYRQAEWFIRERFELLLERLLGCETIRRAASGDGELPGAELTGLRKKVHLLEAQAAEAGYRLDRFLALVQTA